MPLKTFLGAIRLALLQALVAAFAVATSSLQAQAQTRDILVFADASLQNALIGIHDFFLYENAFNVAVIYGESSELARRIENGMPADVFISADPGSMDYLAERKLIEPDSRADLLTNTLVLVAGAGSEASLTMGQNFPLAQALGDGRLAMADPASVPAGKSGRAALEALGVWASVAGKVAPAEHTRAALLSVSRGDAPLGIVYRTDAAADKNVKIVAAFPEPTHPPIVYPIAILANSTNVLASIYVQYLRSPKATPFFEEQGFVVLP